MADKLKWELLAREDDHSDIVTYRARVHGGWLVSTWAERTRQDGRSKKKVPGGANWGGGTTFVPDLHGRWEVEIEPTPTK